MTSIAELLAFGGTGTEPLVITNAGQVVPLPPAPASPVPRHALSERPARTWTNQPAGPTEFTVPIRSRMDLSSATDLRLNFETTTLGVTAALRVDYSTNGTTWTTTGAQVSIGAVGLKTGSWVALPAGAKADVWLRIVAVGGNAVEDPVTRNHEVQVR